MLFQHNMNDWVRNRSFILLRVEDFQCQSHHHVDVELQHQEHFAILDVHQDTEEHVRYH